MSDIAKQINLEFDDDLTCIFNGINVEKLIPQKKLIPRLCIMNEEGPKGESQDQNSEYDAFFKKIESNMLTKMALKGIPYINKVFTKSRKINKFDDSDGLNPEI